MTGPRFIDNRNGNSLARAIRDHLAALRDAGDAPTELCIATGYFNAAGWLMVADEAERLPRLRLLIGAEPSPAAENLPRQPGEPREPERTRRQVKTVLGGQVRALRVERDQEFEFRPDGVARLKRLLEFFRSERVEVRRYEQRFFHAKAWLLKGGRRGVLAGSSNLTAAGLARNLELNLGHYEDPLLGEVEKWFDEVWEQAVPFDLASLYEVLFREFRPWLIYLRVLWELYGNEVAREEEEGVGRFTLTRFQKHGVWRARRLLAELGGVIVADGVGLGKTFLAGELMEGYRDRRQRVLLIRPAALEGMWEKFLHRYMLGDVETISYERLAGDTQFNQEGKRHYLKRPIDEYQLVVIDEAHNYRNPDAPTRAGVLRELMRGPRRDLLLLTATPVNNSLYDLYHLISYFLKQDSALIKSGIPSIKALFDEANHTDPDDLHPDLLYPLVDATTVKRTRQFIKKHYANDRIPGPDGEFVPITFPKPIPKTVRYDLDEALPGFFARIEEALMPEHGDPLLTMARYQVDRYLRTPSGAANGEAALVGLLRSGLLKRFESSAHAFANTCRKMADQHRRFLDALDAGSVVKKDFFKEIGASEDIDDEEFRALLEESEHVEPASLYDIARLRADVTNDLDLLVEFASEAETVQPENDPKLRALVDALVAIAEQAHDESTTVEGERDDRKVLVFSYFRDTALWITRRLQQVLAEDGRLACYRDRFAATSGSPDEAEVLRSDVAVWGFAPRTAAPDTYQDGDRFDILVATDVLAEGVNLQQARHIINYDLPWNPMRLVQRHGRIDRLLSPHRRVYLRTFFPDAALDQLLRLEQRVRRKLALAAASVGVAEAPIEGGAIGEQSFSETREEIERIQAETTTIFEKGGTDSAAQTGEEYRQELRKAIVDGMEDEIQGLPWKAGSGFIGGAKTGFFFCAKIGEQTYLRFVPADARTYENVVEELGTCLRVIECEDATERHLPREAEQAAFAAWALAQENIWRRWQHYTDPKNLQPKVRRLNREVADYLLENPPPEIAQPNLDRASDILLSPWPLREENKLRLVWKDEHPSAHARSKALYDAVMETGIEPYQSPDRFDPIDLDEVRLVCWLYLEAAPTEEPPAPQARP